MKFRITLTQASLLWVGVAILTLCSPYRASAQFIRNNLEVSGGYNHTSGDLGFNGFNLGAGLWVNRRVSLNFDYDWTAKNSTLGVLSLTSFGHTAIKNRLQDWLVGPRIFFPAHKINKYKFDPFAEVKIGGAHESQRINQASGNVYASANSFAWVLGGGTDYQFNSQWFGRVNLDFMRTHFADTGQSRLRFVLGVGYTFSPRRGTE
jgi:hypothetical protein